MADFDKAIALVLSHEGGYVNLPNDPGGPTKYGITQAVFEAYLKRNVSPAEVEAMTVETAKVIYKQKYWAAICGGIMPRQLVANHVLDMAVLRGVTATIKTMQQALGLFADGVAGPKTMMTLQGVDQAQFLNEFRSLCVLAFGSIVAKRPASLPFLVGWLTRAETMTASVALLLTK